MYVIVFYLQLVILKQVPIYIYFQNLYFFLFLMFYSFYFLYRDVQLYVIPVWIVLVPWGIVLIRGG